MKKLILVTTVWLILFIILINSSVVNNKVDIKPLKETASDIPNYTVTGVNSLKNGNKTAVISDTMIVDSSLNQYGGLTCTETLVFEFVREPGQDMTVIDGSDKNRQTYNQVNTIKSGQGFDATVKITATLSPNCASVDNYRILLAKLTNKKALRLYFTSSEDVAIGFGESSSIVYQYDQTSAPVPTANTPLIINFKLPTAYYNQDTGETTYTAGLNGWTAMNHTGYFYTNINTCPKSDSAGNPLLNYYIVEYVYDRTDGANINNANGEPLYPVSYGRNNGQYYLAQELLVSSSRGACLSDDFERMTNNFHFTQIDYKNPFNSDKFPSSELLNWTGLWRADLTYQQNWDRIAGAKYQPVKIDFNSNRGIEQMKELKRLYEEDSSIKIDGYSDTFKKYINDNNKYE